MINSSNCIGKMSAKPCSISSFMILIIGRVQKTLDLRRSGQASCRDEIVSFSEGHAISPYAANQADGARVPPVAVFWCRQHRRTVPRLHHHKSLVIRVSSIQTCFWTKGSRFQNCAKYPSLPRVCLGGLTENKTYQASRITGFFGSVNQQKRGAAPREPRSTRSMLNLWLRTDFLF